MLDHIHLEKIFFMDIETVPQFSNYAKIPDNLKKLWDHKTVLLNKMDDHKSADELYHRAGIYAEFGKIICISVGTFRKIENDNLQFRIKTYYNHNETLILQAFIDLMNDHFRPSVNFLCAHNGREFDFPYISRRILINNLKIPSALDVAGKKPWEIEHLLDTLQLWRFGDYKNFTSLDLLCTILNVPTPKNDISGQDVWKIYWEENDLEKIVKYCEKDVLAIARLMMRFKGLSIIAEENIVHITD